MPSFRDFNQIVSSYCNLDKGIFIGNHATKLRKTNKIVQFRGANSICVFLKTQSAEIEVASIF